MPSLKEYNLLIGRNLHKAREEMGLSQKQIGEVIGVSPQQISKYEQGTNSLSSATTMVICEKLGIKIQKILPAIPRKKKTKRTPPIEVYLHYGKLI